MEIERTGQAAIPPAAGPEDAFGRISDPLRAGFEACVGRRNSPSAAKPGGVDGKELPESARIPMTGRAR